MPSRELIIIALKFSVINSDHLYKEIYETFDEESLEQFNIHCSEDLADQLQKVLDNKAFIT